MVELHELSVRADDSTRVGTHSTFVGRMALISLGEELLVQTFTYLTPKELSRIRAVDVHAAVIWMSMCSSSMIRAGLFHATEACD
jgi:hypothetical protein